MSGTWRERAQAREALKPTDVTTALRDLAVMVDGLGERIGSCNEAELTELRGSVAELRERVVALEKARPSRTAKAES